MKLNIPKEILAQHIAVLGKTGAGKSSAMRCLVEHLLDEKKPVCVHGDVPIDAHSGASIAELVSTGNRPSIIDLGGWTIGDRTKFFIDFAAAMFNHSRGLRWLVIDEAHNFAPKGKIMSPQAGMMLHWANRLASEGRGKGINLIVASQRPQKVHNDLLTSCETIIAMRVIHPRDREAIAEWLEGAGDAKKANEVLDTLALLPRGEGWVWSPEIGFGPERVKFPMFKTFDSFAALANSGDVKLKGWASVNLEEVKAKLASAIEKAKAEDPRELRKRIAELEKQLKAAPAPIAPPVVKEKRVEVAVLKDGQLKRAEDLVAKILGVGGDIANALKLVAASPRASSCANVVNHHPMPREIAQRVVPKIERRDHATPSENGHSLGKCERAIFLAAVAEYPNAISRDDIAAKTGYSHTSGGFSNAMSRLRTLELIDRETWPTASPHMFE